MTDEARRKADLEWLYGGTTPAPTPAAPAPVPAPAAPARAKLRGEAPAPRVRPHPQAALTSAPAADPGRRRTRLGRAFRRHPVRWVVLVAVLLLAAWAAWLVAVPVTVWNKVVTVNTAIPDTGARHAPGTLLLLVGSDSRSTLTQAERDKLGGPDDAGRTDTMMLLYSPKSGQPALISLPRDSYVPIPGHSKNKLNAAYAFGGPPLLRQTVEQVTGLAVDGYLEVDMGGFANLVDAVGGVEVCLDKAVQDTDSQLDLPAGCQHLGGDQALAYARMRKADPLGDLGRIQRQRELIGKIAHKVVTPSTFLNPFRYASIVTSAGETLRRGSDTGTGEAMTAALAIAKIGTGKGLSLTVPVSNPNATTSAGSSVLWDEARAKQMFDDIAAGNTAALAAFVK
ncbi:MAG: LCP family protein [Actinomycetia bacterium]|nr:LCP family protein [Actinomycetes bacterium]